MLTSMILVTRNGLDYTKSCVESIRRHTAAGSYELILVDNGSEDGTADWARAEPDILLIANHDNAGFPKGCNQGASAASGGLLLLLNNDTLVTPGWLDGLKRSLLSDPSIGAAGPVTNSAHYWTQIPSHYSTVEELDRFSESVRLSAGSQSMEERLKLIGFCMLLRREAYEKAGGMDERFGIGNYEDDDLSLRLRLLGYKLMLCRDTFIHHYGSVSFRADSAMYLQLFARNNQLFREKWGFASSEALIIHSDMLGLLDREVSAAGGGTESPRFLNIGCGCGATLLSLRHRFPGALLYGVEKNGQAAKVAEAAGIRVFASEEPEQWGLESGSLDGILIGDAHICGTPEAMRKLKGLLKPAGWLIGTFLNRHYYPFMLRYLQPDNDDAQHQSAYLYSIEQVRKLYADAGFAAVSTLLIDDGKDGRPGSDISAEDFSLLERMANGRHPVKGRLTSGSIITLGLSDRLELPAAAVTEAEPEGRTAVAAVAEELPLQLPSVEGPVQVVPDQLLKEQNDVVFSGERLVVNRQVKEQYADVYEEHLYRYELASRYVKGLKVLDAACGAGYGSALLKRAGASEVTGIDIDAASARLAERDYGGEGIRFEKGDVLKLPFEGESFDAVVSFETIEHVSEGAAWIRESARVLKPGGLFIVSTPNRSVTNPPLYYEEQPFNEYHRFEYRTSELVGELLACYDIEAMFGQNPVDDSRLLSMNWMREKVGLPLGRAEQHLLRAEGHEPLPLASFKSCDPMYVIAVCRKKRTLQS
ncbi:methyltransferase domain-containing protein [Paenibacillus sp. JDR-2]|uniref:methyltransferase domain-containing protein n=1 Tax=Paenibacillus sp. (strain JDR-2) TaxID=324057 RepID=UPI0001667D76|nr:methyltransferase domain-containing protein [Paenibacillus sp. JDR-2]ACT04451.1 glycosyl transferase family 2 [Paenibacillus sp. JDR-2]